MAAISHTPDPVHVGYSISGVPCVSTAARHLAQMLRKPELGHVADADMEANAARLVMCWNFCAGVTACELDANGSLAGYIASNNAELTRLRSDLAAMREALDEPRQELWYMVNNPSAWQDGFSQHGSDVIERAVKAMERALAKGGQP